MSSTRRNDLADRTAATDESNTFKKPFQTVDRPAVTERDFHEEYIQHPPHNEPFEHKAVDHRGRGLKEGAREETEPKQDGVLGDQGVGKQLKQDALQELTTEGSVHPGNPSA